MRLLITHGLHIQDGRIHAGPIELADTAVARAADVDRRIVQATIHTILDDDRLASSFQRLRPTLHLKEAAPALGLGVIEVTPTDASRPGILAGVARIIAEAGHSIRQAVVDDPEFTDEPRLFVVTEEPVDAALIPHVQALDGVRAVTVY